MITNSHFPMPMAYPVIDSSTPPSDNIPAGHNFGLALYPHLTGMMHTIKPKRRPSFRVYPPSKSSGTHTKSRHSPSHNHEQMPLLHEPSSCPIPGCSDPVAMNVVPHGMFNVDIAQKLFNGIYMSTTQLVKKSVENVRCILRNVLKSQNFHEQGTRVTLKLTTKNLVIQNSAEIVGYVAIGTNILLPYTQIDKVYIDKHIPELLNIITVEAFVDTGCKKDNDAQDGRYSHPICTMFTYMLNRHDANQLQLAVCDMMKKFSNDGMCYFNKEDFHQPHHIHRHNHLPQHFNGHMPNNQHLDLLQHHPPVHQHRSVRRSNDGAMFYSDRDRSGTRPQLKSSTPLMVNNNTNINDKGYHGLASKPVMWDCSRPVEDEVIRHNKTRRRSLTTTTKKPLICSDTQSGDIAAQSRESIVMNRSKAKHCRSRATTCEIKAQRHSSSTPKCRPHTLKFDSSPRCSDTASSALSRYVNNLANEDEIYMVNDRSISLSPAPASRRIHAVEQCRQKGTLTTNPLRKTFTSSSIDMSTNKHDASVTQNQIDHSNGYFQRVGGVYNRYIAKPTIAVPLQFNEGPAATIRQVAGHQQNMRENHADNSQKSRGDRSKGSRSSDSAFENMPESTDWNNNNNNNHVKEQLTCRRIVRQNNTNYHRQSQRHRRTISRSPSAQNDRSRLKTSTLNSEEVLREILDEVKTVKRQVRALKGDRNMIYYASETEDDASCMRSVSQSNRFRSAATKDMESKRTAYYY